MSVLTAPAPVAQVTAAKPMPRWLRLTLTRLGVLAVILLAWQGLYSLEILPEVAPSVMAVVTALVGVIASSAFWVALGQTIAAALAGWAIAAVVGVVVGVAIGTSGFATRSTAVVVEFGRSFPMLALMPMVVLVIGVNSRMEILMVFLSCLWPILIQSIAGSRRRDPAVTDTARVFRITRVRQFVRVTIPGALPLIATGLRISLSISILVTVGVGVLSQTPGLGRQITLAQEASRWDIAFAYIIFAGLIGWGLNAALAALETKALKWNRQEA